MSNNRLTVKEYNESDFYTNRVNLYMNHQINRVRKLVEKHNIPDWAVDRWRGNAKEVTDDLKSMEIEVVDYNNEESEWYISNELQDIIDKIKSGKVRIRHNF